MRLKKICGFFLFLIIPGFYSFSQTSKEPKTAQEVLQRCITTMGGEKYLRSIKTLYTEMSTDMDGMPAIWITREMHPNKGAFQILFKGSTLVESWFDGKKGFQLFEGKKTDATKDYWDKAARKNIINNLDYLDTSLCKLELLSSVKERKIECFKIKGIFIDGTEIYLYIDKKNFVTIREDKINRKHAFNSKNYYSDFKKYGQLLFPGHWVIERGKAIQTIDVKNILINQKITNADFTR